MADRLDLTPYPIKPHRIFIIVLAISFGAEFVVMWWLPYILPNGSSIALEAAVDSCLLSILLAPVLWFGIVKPMQKLSESRMEFLRRSMFAQEEERRRIKRELHDEFGQSLTSLQLGLRAMEESTVDPSVVETLKHLREMGSSIHEDLRRLVSGLHPTILDQGGLVDAIDGIVSDFQTIFKGSIDFQSVDVAQSDLDRNYETTVFRIVQEALNNAVKHSQASRISIHLAIQNAKLIAIIEDNGVGFHPDVTNSTSQRSFGLVGMRERAMAIGGHVEIKSSRQGTRVEATLPLNVEGNAS